MATKLEKLKTWVEIDSKAVKHNCDLFRKLIGKNVKLWAVVKSNAYGHGILAFSKLADKFGIDGFCVDSIVEGLRLRKEGIKKHILVLGPTLPSRFADASKNDIALTISTPEFLKTLLSAKKPPKFHLKIDTGMHRQGFYLEDLPKAIKLLTTKNSKLKAKIEGVYTHFASAKDVNYPTYTDFQFQKFQKACRLLKEAGFNNLIRHCAATGGTLIDKKYHQDAVRVGIGLYGLWPSKELEIQLADKIDLRPILSWKTVISEIKKLKPGDFIGYDLVERVNRPTQMAVLPIGYWHGFSRSLSGIGEVLIKGKFARVLGRVSMDLVCVDATGIKCRPGDLAVLIGKSGKSVIEAAAVAQKSGTTHYEFLTRINPLTERVIV